MEDYPFWFFIAHESQIKFFDKMLCCYRNVENSISHEVNIEKKFEFEKNGIDICKFYANIYSYNYIEKNEKELEEYVPVLEQARTIVKQIKLSKIVARTLTLPFIIIFTAVMLIIAALILIIKRRNFNGLLFLGLDFTLVSLALGLTVYFCKSRFVTSLALKMSDFGVSIIESAVSVCADRIIIALIIAAALAILSIMFFAALRYLNSIPSKIGDTSDVITSPCSAEQ